MVAIVGLTRLLPALLLGLFLSMAVGALAPAGAQSTLPEPTRGGGNNSDMWRGVRGGVQGTVSIPNTQAGVLIQSEGENWRNLHNGPIPTYGSWALLGIVVVLALFFAIRGRIRIDAGPSDRRILRFNVFERFVHWVTAVSFIVLGVTGLNVLYGRYVLLPILGPKPFATMSMAFKYAHNFVSFGFTLGIILMFLLWVRHNIPSRDDITWFAMAGGLFSKGKHPPSRKFNAGQKLIFWSVVVLGGIISASGYLLMFPLYWADLQQTQLAQLGHSVLGLLMIAIIVAHIYIGSIGMEGAFDAMGTGMVDENWAREHHNLWVAEVKGEKPPGPGDHGHGPGPDPDRGGAAHGSARPA